MPPLPDFPQPILSNYEAKLESIALKMKTAILFLGVAFAALFSFAAADHSNAQKQHDINSLLWKVNEPLRDDTLKSLGESYDPTAHDYSFDDNGAAVQRLFEEDKDHRLLEQKHWFSLFNERHREEAIMLFEVLINAKDWDTFTSNAAYWRNHMNEGEFVYALYVAVHHSPLAEHVVLPPLYEVTPHLFTSDEVIEKAYHAKMTQTPGKFKSHWTGTKKNKEQRVAYFGEDIGMNTHHVSWHMEFPFWWKDSYGHKLDRKGENFYWVHNQLTHRFDAERISNFLEPTEELDWNKPIHEGFAPHTTYKYGGQFPARPDDVEWSDVDGVARVRDMIIYDNRIRDSIAHGFVVKEDGTQIDIQNDQGADILGDIIESSNYSPNVHYYGALHNTAHIMLGRQADPHGKFGLPPGVMEHFETATRDPSFFRLHKYMDNIFREHKDSLPAYKTEDLVWEGVSVTGLSVTGDLETYLEDFEYSLVNAVDDTPEIEDVEISTYVPRLNHKEFYYNININNAKGSPQLATIRIFGWAHRDQNGEDISFDEGRWAALELDKFWVNLKSGSNKLVRKSTESSVTVADVPSFKTIKDSTEAALKSGGNLDLHDYESSTGMPNRFLIPKGHKNGMEFDIVVCVTDGQADAAVDNLHENDDFIHYGAHGVYPDKRPHGYPLDRHYDDPRVFEEVPNYQHTVVKIFHIDH